MINPADARAVYFYTPAEVSTARYILKNQGLDRYGLPLYPETWYKWACKVCTWYGRFLQVLRRYARALSSVALAQVAIWQNLKAGLSVPRMLRQEATTAQEERTSAKTRARWVKNPPQARDEHARQGSFIAPHTEKRSHKAERRAQVVRLTNALQSAAL